MQSLCLRYSLSFLLLCCFAVTVAEEVCYGKYGCFDDNPPFDRSIFDLIYRRLPDAPEEMQIEYFLFTRADRIGYKTLDDNNSSKLEASTYDGSKKTILITHGWTGKPLESPWVKGMKDALLVKEDVNVIIVGWKEGANDLYYPQAVGNTRLVGAMIAEFIKFLNTQTQNTPDSFHMIGFSLGGQVSGYAGKRFQEITEGTKIGRITGLDPASPGYKDNHIDVRLDATDAEFVDVIHSDSPRIGTPDKSGKFDFWPNGGETQPGCEFFKRKRRGVVDYFTEKVGCEHYRAHQFFIESIKSSECKFRSYRCQSWKEFTRGECMECGTDGNACPEIGYNAINYKDLESGNFYLNTNAKAPYCVSRYMYVTFETGSEWLGVGDGHNPRVKIYGSKGDTGEIKFNGELNEGSTEQFLAPIGADLGELQSVAVKNHMSLNVADPWKVQKVTVQYEDSEQSYSACFDSNVFRIYKKKSLTRGNAQCKRKHSIRGRPRNKARHIGSRGTGRIDRKPILKKKVLSHSI